MENAVMDFDTCYRTYYDRLYRVAYRIAGNREDAEDALQDAYVSAYRSRDSFRGDSALGTWLYRITVNSTLRYIRKRKSFPISQMAHAAGLTDEAFFESLKSRESVEDTVLTENLREACLQMFIECMPRQQRIAFVLKVLMQLPGREVADIMGISPGAVKTNVYRARQLMVAHMAGRCSLVRRGNPCSCGHWAAYTLETGKSVYFNGPAMGRNPALDYKQLFLSELGFMGKLKALYDVQPEGTPCDAFISKMKLLMAEERLVLLK